ncbi:hypothetical protein KWH18_19360 [Xanthomonas campestris pv. viegasii]|nr:hypothetical protein [Xanthomonas euvesicatoria]MBV6831131.1 hypothetical protein [Xanthomonas campestris pv. viegasii]
MPDTAGVAQDFHCYSLADYQRRRRRGGPTQWDSMRGASRLDWPHVRDIVEDAWLALDHIPEAAIHGAAH